MLGRGMDKMLEVIDLIYSGSEDGLHFPTISLQAQQHSQQE